MIYHRDQLLIRHLPADPGVCGHTACLLLLLLLLLL